MYESGVTTLIISNEEMNDIMKIVKLLEESCLLIKSVWQIIKKETKEQKGGFLGMLLGTLCASLLGNLLTDKVEIASSQGHKVKMPGQGTTKAGEGTVRACQDL